MESLSTRTELKTIFISKIFSRTIFILRCFLDAGVWFTTDGATSEISEVIGRVVEKEDVNERPIVIGIASWEYLRMNEHLVTKNVCSLFVDNFVKEYC